MSARSELAAWVAAAKGAVAWMQESGEDTLTVPDGFELPPLGRVAPAPRSKPRPQARQPQPQPRPGSVVAAPQASEMPSMATGSSLGGSAPGETIVLLGAREVPALVAEGPQPAKVMFLGEPHGRTLPDPLRPFDGAAGDLLHKMIRAMGLSREEVALVNVLDQGGVRWCGEHLRAAVSAFQPEVIVAMGVFPARTLLDVRASMARMRGNWYTLGEDPGLPVMVTFPPGLLLRHPDLKRPVWGDLKKVMGRLGLEPPRR